MAKSPVLPVARLAEAKVIKGKPKGKGLFPAKAMAKQKARDYFLASPRLPKATAKAKAMAKQKARDYSLASPRFSPCLPKAKAKAKAMAKLKAKAWRPKVVMYMRTSSAANVGDDKDSESRQRARCQEFADNRSMTIMQEYKDPAVSGTDPLISRPGFSHMVADCIEYGIRTMLVESGDRFARDLVVQETGIQWLRDLGIEVVCADNMEQYTNPGCTGALVRQMLGAVNEFVAAQVRERLRHGRQKALASVAADPGGKRSYKNNPKVGGPESLLEHDPELVSEMKVYAKMDAKKRPSLNDIAKNLRTIKRSWSVRKGKNKGKPWARKQIRLFLKKLDTEEPKTKKPAARTKKPNTKEGAKASTNTAKASTKKRAEAATC